MAVIKKLSRPQQTKAIKYILMAYFRYYQAFPLIATEVNPIKADVLVSNYKSIYEIEVKTSFSDMKNDLNKRKHILYGFSPMTPTHFYFAVPPKLTEKAELVVFDTDYGLVEVDPLQAFTPHRGKFKPVVKIIKKSLRLANYCEQLEHRLRLRMSSELVGLHRKNL